MSESRQDGVRAQTGSDPATRESDRTSDRRRGQLFEGVFRAVALAATAFVLLVVLLTVTGQRTSDALVALVNGAVGSWYAITSATLVRAVPLALAGLAVSLAFRAGILNIGAEGQLLAGAAAATFASLAAPQLGAFVIPLLLAAGCVAGAAWAGIAAFLRQKLGVLEVISTIMLNYVAFHTVGYLVRGPLQESTHVFPQSFNIDAHAHLPAIIPGTRLHLGFALAVIIGIALWWWLRDRAGGFRLRAVGANPRAAASAGSYRCCAHNNTRISHERRNCGTRGRNTTLRCDLFALRNDLARLRIHSNCGCIAGATESTGYASGRSAVCSP